MDHDSQVHLVIKKFQCADPDYKLPDKLDIETQERLFHATVDDPHHVRFPIRINYQMKFMKEFIDKSIEEDEVHEGLLLIFNKYLSNTDRVGLTQFRHYVMENNSLSPRLIIEESMMSISEGTTGLRTWEAATVLAEWCVANSDQIMDKKIVELGSGVGLTGLTILNLTKPKKYTFTDCHYSVLEMLKKNLTLNLHRMHLELDEAIECVEFEWGSMEKYVDADWTEPDIVIAADVVYDPDLFPDLILALKGLLNQPNSFGVIGLTIRNEKTVSSFLEALDKDGLKWEDERIPASAIFLAPKNPVRIIKIHNHEKFLR